MSDFRIPQNEANLAKFRDLSESEQGSLKVKKDADHISVRDNKVADFFRRIFKGSARRAENRAAAAYFIKAAKAEYGAMNSEVDGLLDGIRSRAVKGKSLQAWRVKAAIQTLERHAPILTVRAMFGPVVDPRPEEGEYLAKDFYLSQGLGNGPRKGTDHNVQSADEFFLGAAMVVKAALRENDFNIGDEKAILDTARKWIRSALPQLSNQEIGAMKKFLTEKTVGEFLKKMAKLDVDEHGGGGAAKRVNALALKVVDILGKEMKPVVAERERRHPVTGTRVILGNIRNTKPRRSAGGTVADSLVKLCGDIPSQMARAGLRRLDALCGEADNPADIDLNKARKVFSRLRKNLGVAEGWEANAAFRRLAGPLLLKLARRHIHDMTATAYKLSLNRRQGGGWAMDDEKPIISNIFKGMRDLDDDDEESYLDESASSSDKDHDLAFFDRVVKQACLEVDDPEEFLDDSEMDAFFEPANRKDVLDDDELLGEIRDRLWNGDEVR